MMVLRTDSQLNVSKTADSQIETAYRQARDVLAGWSVDAEQALATLACIPISLHCWQGDDVAGFENTGTAIGGGLAVTGNYPGRARNPQELRQDLELALSLIPGPSRLNLHASYAETGGRRVERDAMLPEHFQGWIDWARSRRMGLDFNPTFFAHPLANSGLTLAHPDKTIREFWIAHGQACRRIAAAMGREQGAPCINNLWIPDGSKDMPVDRRGPRELLIESLDRVFAEAIDPQWQRDAVEAKLFGLGSEAYVVGSHEFYLGYAISRKKILCLDAGHFHPTETISDKISAVLNWVGELLLHVSRGIRWDSDHVVTFTDDLQAITQEAVRGKYLDRIHFGLDFFDASINRISAWVIGTRTLRKALLYALLEPRELLQQAERSGNFGTRLALLEEFRTSPWGAVWDYHCLTQQVPVGRTWLDDVQKYESQVLSQRK